MRLPFNNAEEYKDKPLPPHWRHRSIRSKLWSRRCLSLIGLFVIVIYCLRRSLFPSTASTISVLDDDYGDDDLYVEKSWQPPGLESSLDAARLTATISPIQNVFILLNGLSNADSGLADLGCEMSRGQQGATVHFLVLGGGHTTVENFKMLHQFGENCKAFFHDARTTSDESPKQSQMYTSYAANAMKLIVEHHGPAAIVYTHSRSKPKPNWFLAALEPHKSRVTMVELTQASLDSLGWIAHLSPRALNAWSKPRIDLVVDAGSHAGTLDRLFKSLAAAHYPSEERPLLFVNFDASSSESARTFALRFADVWPRERLVLRRRVDPSRHSFLEDWYPVGDDHHALSLSDGDELSPFFHHYLLFGLLHYRYDDPGRWSQWHDKTYGIALRDCPAKAREEFHVDTGSEADVDLRRNPSLASLADTRQPVLFFPAHFTALHESLHAGKSEGDHSAAATAVVPTVDEVWRAHVERNKLVLLCPPTFQYDDGKFVLTKGYVEPVLSPAGTLSKNHRDAIAGKEDQAAAGTDGTKEGEEEEDRLVRHADWWKSLGRDLVMMPWSRLQLRNAAGESRLFVEFFTKWSDTE